MGGNTGMLASGGTGGGATAPSMGGGFRDDAPTAPGHMRSGTPGMMSPGSGGQMMPVSGGMNPFQASIQHNLSGMGGPPGQAADDRTAALDTNRWSGGMTPMFGSMAPLAGMFGTNQAASGGSPGGSFGAGMGGGGTMPAPAPLITQPQPNPNPAWQSLPTTPPTPAPVETPAQPTMMGARPAFIDQYLNSGRPDQEKAAMRYMRDLKAGTAPAAPSIIAPVGYQAMGGRRGGGRGG